MNTHTRTSAPTRGAAGTPALILALSAMAFLVGACADEFDPYERLDGTRLLAVRADKPSIREGETARLEALVFTEEAGPISYRWSWCPVQGDPSDGFVCPVTDEDLATMVSATGSPASGPLVLDLGDEPTAELPFPGDARLVASVCEAMLSRPIPPHIALPDCSRGLEVFVKVEVRSAQQTINAVKVVELLIDPDAAPNTNPVVEGLTARAVDGRDEAPLELLDGQVNLLPAAETLGLSLRLADHSVEAFAPSGGADSAPVAETPMLTWFVQTGDLDATRTGVVEGATTLEDALENAWHPGGPTDDVSLVVVVRDGRGGVDWTHRRVRIGE